MHQPPWWQVSLLLESGARFGSNCRGFGEGEDGIEGGRGCLPANQSEDRSETPSWGFVSLFDFRTRLDLSHSLSLFLLDFYLAMFTRALLRACVWGGP